MTMAYLDLAEPGFAIPAPFASIRVRPVVGAPAAEFSQREWTVIGLARDDGLSSLHEGSEFGDFVRFLFGFERKRPLTDTRLEALRRIAVLSWHHGYNVDSSAVSEFLAAGYSTDHYDAMLAHIGSERAASFQRNRR